MKYLSCLFILLIVSCSSDPMQTQEESGFILAPSNARVKDISNYGDSRDIKLSFTKPNDISQIMEFRIQIIRAELNMDLDTAQLMGLPGQLSLASSASSSNFRFDEDQADSEGNPIQEDIEYRIAIWSKAIEGSGLTDSDLHISDPFTLTKNNIVRTLSSSINEGSGGMDIDTDGNIYMADFGRATNNPNGTNVIKISPEGEISNFANGLSGASGNDFDNMGNLYQSNIAGNTVSKISPDGTSTTFATGLVNPVGIAFDGNSSFYVCNCGNNTISKINMEGEVSFFASNTNFNCPNGIDIDIQGNIYVASFGNPTIVKITPDGASSAFATMPGNNNGHLLVRGNNIYVVSRGLHQIHRVSLQGIISLVAGNGQRGIIDGPVEEASFSLPNDIAISQDGKYIYVNDVNGSDPNQAIISPTIIRVIEIHN